MEIPNEHIFSQAYAETQSRAMLITEKIRVALAGLTETTVVYPEDNGLASQLKAAAKLIAVQKDLEMPRQFFYVEMGGFDTHDKQVQTMDDLFLNLSQAIDAFQKNLEEFGVADRVLTFAASEFGRMLTSNGDGTDHGWGSHLFVLGKSVRGKEIYGTMPALTIDGADDSGDGRIIPTTSFDQYGATLSSWLGFTDSELDQLFPNLSSYTTKKLGIV